jgi:hypothetical protein
MEANSGIGIMQVIENMVARDGVEPPTPAFSVVKQQALPRTYKLRETAEVLGRTCNTEQLLTGIADRENRSAPVQKTYVVTQAGRKCRDLQHLTGSFREEADKLALYVLARAGHSARKPGQRTAAVLRSHDEIETRSIDERAKIPVSRQERNTAINAALSDQSVSESRLVAL